MNLEQNVTLQEYKPPFVLTVSQLTNAIKVALEKTFSTIWLKGEISNFKIQSSGHLYFSLKDANSQISCAYFRQNIDSKLLPHLKDGALIIVQGELSVWAPRGNYQLIIREIRLEGVGNELLKLEQLKKKLSQLGYFQKPKKSIPRFPKVIGVITSPTGAVIQDIIHILSRRLRGFNLILYPVKVQGEGAKEEIAQAIARFNNLELADVLIVGRGGGSFEDLLPFNSEEVARAIFESTLPIISAVGHETDVSIADFVSDVRAPTPSAAAELVSEGLFAFESTLFKLMEQIALHLQKDIISKKKMLAQLSKNPFFTSKKALEPFMQKLDEIGISINQRALQYVYNKKQNVYAITQGLKSLRPDTKIAYHKQQLASFSQSFIHLMQSKCSEYKQRLVDLTNDIQREATQYIQRKKMTFIHTNIQEYIDREWQLMLSKKSLQIEQIEKELYLLNPKNLLEKGYAIVFSQKDNSIVQSAKNVELHESVRMLFHDGEVEAKITKIQQ